MSEAKAKLLAIANGDMNVEGWDYNVGLCTNLSRLLQYDGCVIDDVLMPKWAADWPHLSGSRYYPVPHTQEELQEMRNLFPKQFYKNDHELMYNGRKPQGTLYTGTYGKMRRDLARHIAGKLT